MSCHIWQKTSRPASSESIRSFTAAKIGNSRYWWLTATCFPAAAAAARTSSASAVVETNGFSQNTWTPPARA